MVRQIILALVLAVFNVSAGWTMEWSEPVLLEELNSPSALTNANAPSLSRDGLTIYFERREDDSYRHIIAAYRDVPSGPFTSEEILTDLDNDKNLYSPWISADNLRLYLSCYMGGTTRMTLIMAERVSTSDPWIITTIFTDIHVNGKDDAYPSLTEDELTLYFLTNRSGDSQVWKATRNSIGDQFSNPTPVTELNNFGDNGHTCVSPDDLYIYFVALRSGESQKSINKANRASTSEPFGNFERIEIPGIETDDCGSLYVTPNEKEIYFTKVTGTEVSGIWFTYLISAVYHVDGTDGSDENSGWSRESAFATIAKGIEVAEEGDTILVWPGLYEEEVDFSGKAITIKSADYPATIQAPTVFDDAVLFVYEEGPESVLENFIIQNSDNALLFAASSPTIRNITIVNNNTGAKCYAGATPDISSSIFWDNDDDLDNCTARYSCIEDGDPGQGNISTNPFFADPNNHLLSQRGRYVPDKDYWVLDETTSPCVDGSDPTIYPENEATPNGARVNMGAYGNTAYASLSEWPLSADINRDGTVNLLDFALFAQDFLWTAPWYE